MRRMRERVGARRGGQCPRSRPLRAAINFIPETRLPDPGPCVRAHGGSAPHRPSCIARDGYARKMTGCKTPSWWCYGCFADCATHMGVVREAEFTLQCNARMRELTLNAAVIESFLIEVLGYG